MNDIELIKSLIDEANKLPQRDDAKLDKLKRRADMIIRKIFGRDSHYLEDLKEISLHPSFAPASDEQYNKYWSSGKSALINLFEVMLEDFELSESSEEE